MNEEIEQREKDGLLFAVHRRNFRDDDLKLYDNTLPKPALKNFNEEEYKLMDEYIKETKFEMILVAIDDPIESKKIYYLSKDLGYNVNIADVPPLCDFYFGAILRRGDLQIMVSTNGKGPRMAKLIKDKIGETFKDYEIDKTINNIGELRKLLRIKCKGTDNESIKLRMEWMLKVTDMYSFREWSKLNNLQKIIDYFPNYPPSFNELNK